MKKLTKSEIITDPQTGLKMRVQYFEDGSMDFQLVNVIGVWSTENGPVMAIRGER